MNSLFFGRAVVVGFFHTLAVLLFSMFFVWTFTMLINYIFESKQKEKIKNKFSKKPKNSAAPCIFLS